MAEKNNVLAVARQAKQLVSTVRRQRKKLELSQSALAAKAGLDQVTISRIEKELIDPKLATFFKLLAALDLELVVRSRKKTRVI